MSTYAAFLDSKTHRGADHGFEPLWIPDWLFDFQKEMVSWSLRADRAAFLEISRQYRPKREPQAKPKERTGPTLAERRETTRINLKEAERLRAEGVTDHAISAGLGISRSTIRRYLGPPPHRKGVEHPERKNLEPQARHLRGQGWSYRRIGREIGVHHWTVQTWLEGAGA